MLLGLTRRAHLLRVVCWFGFRIVCIARAYVTAELQFVLLFVNCVCSWLLHCLSCCRLNILLHKLVMSPAFNRLVCAERLMLVTLARADSNPIGLAKFLIAKGDMLS